MSTEFNTDVSDGASSPAVGSLGDSTSETGSSPVGQESGSGVSTQTAGGVTAASNGQDNSGVATDGTGTAAPAQETDPLEGVPSLEELSQNQNQPYAKALVQLRTAYEALKPKAGEFEPWRPVSEKYGSPDEVLTYAELGRSLFTPLEKDGQTVLDPDGLPQSTALPFLLNVFKQSPEQGARLIGDALDIRLKTPDGRVDTAFNLRLQELGLDPSKIEQYAEWGRTGAPVAQSGVDSSVIPEQSRAAFSQLPAVKQRDIVNLLNSASEEDREVAQYDLAQAQRQYEQAQGEVRAREQAAREAQATIERNTQVAVQGKLETGVDQFLQHLSEWKPTADDEVNRTYHLETASSLLNLLDPSMAKINNMLYATLGMQPDADIPKLNEQFQQQTRLAEHYKSIGETFKSADALRSADSAYMRLVAKLNGVAGRLIEHKSRVAKLQTQAAAADGQRGRVGVTGQPGALPAQGGNPNWIRGYYD